MKTYALTEKYNIHRRKMTSKRKEKPISNVMSTKTKDFIQKICYRKTASIDMTRFGFVNDRQLHPVNLLMGPLKAQLKRICGKPSRESSLRRNNSLVGNKVKMRLPRTIPFEAASRPSSSPKRRRSPCTPPNSGLIYPQKASIAYERSPSPIISPKGRRFSRSPASSPKGRRSPRSPASSPKGRRSPRSPESSPKGRRSPCNPANTPKEQRSPRSGACSPKGRRVPRSGACSPKGRRAPRNTLNSGRDVSFHTPIKAYGRSPSPASSPKGRRSRSPARSPKERRLRCSTPNCAQSNLRTPSPCRHKVTKIPSPLKPEPIPGKKRVRVVLPNEENIREWEKNLLYYKLRQ